MQALGLKIRGVSTIAWPALSPLALSEIWRKSPTVSANPISPSGIREDGTGGLADLGSIPTTAKDLFVLLDVG